MEFTQKSGENMKLEIQAVMSGYDVKISGEKVLGTLHIDDEGLFFSSPNKKKKTFFFMPWDKLEALLKIGENFQNVGNH